MTGPSNSQLAMRLDALAETVDELRGREPVEVTTRTAPASLEVVAARVEELSARVEAVAGQVADLRQRLQAATL